MSRCAILASKKEKVSTERMPSELFGKTGGSSHEANNRSVGSCTRKGFKPVIQGEAVAGSTRFNRAAASGSTESDTGQSGIVEEPADVSQVGRLGIFLSGSSGLQ
jgi:hypothetical protein